MTRPTTASAPSPVASADFVASKKGVNETRICFDCRAALGLKAKTDRCPSCRMKAMRLAPGFEERRAAAFKAKIQNDPEFRAKHAAASLSRIAKWRSDPATTVVVHANSLANLAKANAPESLEKRAFRIRKIRHGDVPEARWDEYAKLRGRIGAPEAKRVILEDEMIRARRQITDFDANQRARVQRRRAQEY